jgi:hypothetical protein
MSRPVTPASGAYGSIPATHSEVASHPTASRPVSGNLDIDQISGNPRPQSALSGHEPLNDESGFTADRSSMMHRSNSQMSQSHQTPQRSGTLKKKASLKRTGSLGRTASRKSSYAGSVRSMRLGEKEKYEETAESNSAFWCPVPTSGNPTELLADRFQGMRPKCSVTG